MYKLFPLYETIKFFCFSDDIIGSRKGGICDSAYVKSPISFQTEMYVVCDPISFNLVSLH